MPTPPLAGPGVNPETGTPTPLVNVPRAEIFSKVRVRINPGKFLPPRVMGPGPKILKAKWSAVLLAKRVTHNSLKKAPTRFYGMIALRPRE